MPKPTPKTQLIQAEIGTDTAYNAISPPLYLSSTYKFNRFNEIPTYEYGRSSNPNRDGLGRALAKLEDGAQAVITASGMAAIDLITRLFNHQALIIAPHDCYGGTYRLLENQQKMGRLRVHFVDQSNSDSLAEAFALKPALVFIETPSNPLMRLVDIDALSHLAHQAGALVVVDNTFLSPARQKPFHLGADFVVHSTTKFINGHSDVIGGVALAKTPDWGEQLQWWANCAGLTAAPFDCYQTLRGLRTLHIRLAAQEANAMALAEFLRPHSAIKQVFFPGLESDPYHQLMLKQQSGPGAILAFTLKGGTKAAQTLLNNLHIFQLAESLGGVESLISHPVSMTHRNMNKVARRIAGIEDGLIRISTGLEDINDLQADLTQALAHIGKK